VGWPAETIARLRVDLWRPSILHAHFGTRGWEALSLKRRYSIPLITSFYGLDAWLLPIEQPVWRQRYTDLFKDGDLFLVEGPVMQQRLVSLGCPAEKIQIHRIGVQSTLFKCEEKNFSEGLKIAMVGRFIEKKGFVDGLRACANARKSGIDLHVTIIGDALCEDSVSQEIKQELLAIASSAEMTGHVRFTGFLPQAETRALLELHNVLLCPSKHASSGDAEGGSPVVLTESMAMGLLCIGTRHCDIPEVIIDQQTGLLFEEGNVEELTDILCGLLAGREKPPRLIQLGSKHVEEKFNLTVQLEDLSRIYKDVLRLESAVRLI
jgi:colanic acid/amylovoran biosynthesis glycosyltransferase